MPFIEEQKRPYYDNILDQLNEIICKGDLEYCIYKLILHYMKTRKYNYHNLHEAVYGTIHSAEEFKRNYLDKREDEAIAKNGKIIINTKLKG